MNRPQTIKSRAIKRETPSTRIQSRPGFASVFRSDGGFTLTEMMIVIAIILMITIASIPLLMPALADRKIKDAAGTLQAALIGARDRATSSGQIQGLRLLRDPAKPFEVSSLAYIGSPEPYSVGGPVDVVTGTLPNTSLVVVNSAGLLTNWEGFGIGPDGKPGKAGVNDDAAGPVDDAAELGFQGSDDIPIIDRTGQAYIRFNGIGPYYQIIANGVVVVSGQPAPVHVRLVISPVAPVLTAASYQIVNPPVQLPNTKLVDLPGGIVIDVRSNLPATLSTHPFYTDPKLNVPRSRFIPNQVPAASFLAGPNGTFGNADDPTPAEWPPMDILFAPNGLVVGPAASSPVIHLWIGESGDPGTAGPDGIFGDDPATAGIDENQDDVAPQKNRRLVTLLTRTGAVQVYEALEHTGTRPNFPEIYSTVENFIGVPRKKAAE